MAKLSQRSKKLSNLTNWLGHHRHQIPARNKGHAFILLSSVFSKAKTRNPQLTKKVIPLVAKFQEYMSRRLPYELLNKTHVFSSYQLRARISSNSTVHEVTTLAARSSSRTLGVNIFLGFFSHTTLNFSSEGIFFSFAKRQ
jgi:hypothetical protein